MYILYIYIQYRTFDVSLYITVLKNSPDFDLKQIHNDSPAFRIWHWSVTVTRVSTLILDPLLGLLEIVGASQPIQYIKNVSLLFEILLYEDRVKPFHVCPCHFLSCLAGMYKDSLTWHFVFPWSFQAGQRAAPPQELLDGRCLNIQHKESDFGRENCHQLVFYMVFGFWFQRLWRDFAKKWGVRQAAQSKKHLLCKVCLMNLGTHHELTELTELTRVTLISWCFAGPEIAAVRRSLEAHIGKAGDTIDIAEFLSAWKCAAGVSSFRHVLQGVAGAIGIQRPHRTRFQEKLCQT